MRDDYVHPVTSLWQKVLNAHPALVCERQQDLPPSRARACPRCLGA